MSAYRTSGSLDDSEVSAGDVGFSRVNMRDEPEQLEETELALSLNGRLERRSWQPRKAITSLSGSLQVDGDPLLLPFYLVDEPGGRAIDSAARVDELVTLTINAHGFENESNGWLGVSGLAGSVNPNGQRFLYHASANTMQFLIPGAIGSETYTGSGLVANYLDDDAAAAIWGSCLFSDPSSLNAESIIEAASGTAFKVDTADGTVTEIGYPVGFGLSGPCELEQAFDRVFLWVDGVRSLEWLAGASDFTEVPGGTYVQPQVFEATGTNVTVASGLVTVTIAGNTTIDAEDTAFIYGSDDPHFEPFVGRNVKVITANATTVTFYLPVEDLSTIGGNVFSIGKQVSVGGGFSYMPAPPWGVYHQRRMICPFRYTVGEDMGDPTYTDRDVRDELVISDILDPHTYDTAINQFRITAGVADFIVGAHPFADDMLLVFMRNSIHVVNGLSGALADCKTKELTQEIGCLARKSVAQYASQVLFLADSGVYAIGFLDQYNLRPVGEPLSAPIQPIIDRINADLAGNSVGIYFNNRYWLAVPLDSARGANDATGNNSILVFSFLNGGWESIDSVNDPRWNVLNLHVSRAGERNDLYAVNTLGGVHKLDAVDDDADTLALTPASDTERIPVVSSMRTRRYDGGTLERKSYKRVQITAESAGQASDAAVSFSTEEPDNTVALGTFSSDLASALEANNGASMRFRPGGYRGQGASVTITPQFGRPKIKSIKVEATTANRSTTAQK